MNADYVTTLIARYCNRTRGSKALSSQSKPFLAEPFTPLPFHEELKEMCYPITVARCDGARFWDVDSNEYIDFCMGFGSCLFGHNPPFLKQALASQIDQGFSLGVQSAQTGEVAKLVCELTDMERVAFACSGTEAVMIALRLARTATSGRERIALFAGAYHGQYDGTLATRNALGSNPYGVPNSTGIPPRYVANVLVLPDYSEHSLELIRLHGAELAAVIVEPSHLDGSGPEPKRFLETLRRVTTDHEIVLIFDELISGFRTGLGGAQAWFGVRADLAIFGKAIGAGLPIALIAGIARVMNAIDGGPWNFGDSSTPEALTAFVASTFAKHPLSLAATLGTLREIAMAGPALQTQLREQTSRFVADLNRSLEKAEAPLRFKSFASYFRPAPPFDGSPSVEMQLFHYCLIERGIFLPGGHGFLSTAHRPDDLIRLSDAALEIVNELRENGRL